MIETLKKEALSTFWIAVAVLFILCVVAGPAVLMMWLVGPFTFVGFIFWSVVWLILRAGITRYV